MDQELTSHAIGGLAGSCCIYSKYAVGGREMSS